MSQTSSQLFNTISDYADDPNPDAGISTVNSQPSVRTPTTSQAIGVQTQVNPTKLTTAQQANNVVTNNSANKSAVGINNPAQIAKQQVTNNAPLKFAADAPKSWLPNINGIQLNKCRVKMSDASGGVRADVIAQLAYHYPQIRAQGYELVQFTIELFAWDQESFNELQWVLNSVLPSVPTAGTKVQKPPVSTIIYPGLNDKGMKYFLPIKPTTPFMFWDSDNQGYTCKFTFLQWNPIATPAYPQFPNPADPSPPGTPAVTSPNSVSSATYGPRKS
jgi:hypothetical protein